MNSDLAVVREYAQRQSENAFALPVSHHTKLVYWAGPRSSVFSCSAPFARIGNPRTAR